MREPNKVEEAICLVKEGKKVIIKRRNLPFELDSFLVFEKELSKIVIHEDDLFVIYDASEANSYSNGTMQKAFTQWLKKYDAILKENVKCAVFIVPSLLSQMTLETVFLMKPSFKHKVFTNQVRAQNWIEKELSIV